MQAKHEDSLFNLGGQSGPIEGMAVRVPPLKHHLVCDWCIKRREFCFEEPNHRYELSPHPYLYLSLDDLALVSSALRNLGTADSEEGISAKVVESHAELEVSIDIGESIWV